MKSRSLHNSTKKRLYDFFTVTLRPFIKYHSPPYFPSHNITKNAETHPPTMRDRNFKPDPTKQAQEVIFSRKTKKLPHLPLVFNNVNVTQSIYQKHLGIILDSKLTFENHLNMGTTQIN